MPTYTYTDGDGLSLIDKTVPNGAVEPVSNLDDAIKQVKAYLNDATAGPKALIDSLTVIVGTNTSDIAAGEVDITALKSDTKGKCIVTKTAPQVISSGSGATIIQFDHEEFDVDNAFDVTTYSYTVPKTGLYTVIARVRLTTNVSAAPADISITIGIYVGGVLGAEVKKNQGTDETSVDLVLPSMFNLGVAQILQCKITITVSSGSIAYNVDTTATATAIQFVRSTE